MIIIVTVVISSIVAWKWAQGIDDMKNLHPDYNGEDFLEW